MLTLSHVLCPTDFSDVSEKAEAYAVSLARRYDARLHLLHVEAPITVVAPYGDVPIDPRFFEQQRELALKELAAARDRALAAGIAADTDVMNGPPARTILDAATATGTDLIVLGTHGRGGFEHLLIGSVAEKVLRKATCAVMVVPPAATPNPDVLFSKILCPIDGSAASHDAVAFAVSLARETDGVITLMQVVEPVPTTGEFGMLDTEEYRRVGEAHAAKTLRTAVAEDVRAWCRTEELVTYGKASTRILDVAAERRADVIVMGVRGRGALDLAAFGSTTNDVIRRAACPVIAVHHPTVDTRRIAPSAATVVA